VVEIKQVGARTDEDPLVTLERKYLFDHSYVAILAGSPEARAEEPGLALHVAELPEPDSLQTEIRATFFHGAPSVASVLIGLGGDPYVPASGQLVFGSFETRIPLPVADTTIFLLDATNRRLLAKFEADLASWNLEHSTLVLLTSPLMVSGDGTASPQGRVGLRAALPGGGPLVSLDPTVPEPWWRQPWMLVVLLLGLAVVGLIVFQLRILRLRARERELSALVGERTRELVAEKEKTEEQARRLSELDEAKNRFFANISHEFRTPLTLILGPLQDALDGRYKDRPEQFEKQVGVMHRSARRLLRLINQLLDLSRLESGEMKLRKEVADLADFTRHLALSFVPLAERRGIQLQVPSEVEALPFEFDPDALEKTLGNLVSNALKFTPEGGKVHVGLRTEPPENPSHVGIFVKDTGPGISSEDLERIFDRFQQADTSIRRPFEGSGIGLALAKELTELHRGQLLVESTPGFGTTFTVRLPLPETLPSLAVGEDNGRRAAGVDLEEAALESGGPPSHSVPATDGDRPVILIVEDNPDVRAYVRDHLEKEYRIVETEDGEQGLAAAREHKPALVLADVMMPNMDGYEMCRLIKANEELRHIPVVMLTAKAAERDTLEGLQSGADDYLAKPFSVNELKARAANLISTRREMREKFSREIIVRPGEITITPEEETFLDHVLEVVNAHLGDSNLTVDWLADEVGLSRRQLERRVETVTGQSPASLVRHLRLERASQLLRAGAGTVSEIAYAVGFKSAAHFSRAFKEVYGETPSVHMQVDV
jgi:signal transduction histidine kinase/DNA-binding response OmpR family regulator